MGSALRLAPALAALAVATPPAAVKAPLDPRPAATGAPGLSQLAPAWSALEPGLELAVFAGPAPVHGDGKVWVVRVDPARFDLRLVNASASDGRPRTVRAWAAGAGASVATNAGMFQTDGLTSVALMRTRLHENNPRRSARYKALLALDPLRSGLAPVRILDVACGEAESFTPLYGTLVQSIRMVSCDRKNVWAPDARRWSAAALGVDGAGRVLLVHARSPWPVHELVDALLALPIDLRRAMYLEGGPEAQLYVRAAGREVERLGTFEGGVRGDDGGLAWEIPNAIVAVRKGR